ncbi:hypothetical protein RhiirA1_448152 [Rhizophagus irregularis]|uniref:Uncharacterized protein n=1 Tax=Rhizophagus irregularis TaxID=588596 RepID=A0A2N0SK59_9GLOM|nr:hypothetical protein RhiirA1_448152 [Rhizophagus irregularis]
MSIVESGFGRLRFVDPPTKSDLKKMCDDDNTLKISMWIQNQCFLHVQEKILYVDEPFAINTLFNFFENNKELSDEILEIMSIVNNPSACEFEQMFNGKVDVYKMPIFSEIAKKYELPAFCIGSPKIVKSFNENIPLIKNAITSGYTLDEFFTESPEVPVFFQIKLRYSVKTLAGALSTVDPYMFYKNKNGDMYQETYPADVSIESFITNGRYELRKSSLCVKKRNKSKKVDEKDEDMGEADEEEKMGEDMGDRERVTNRKKDKSKPKRVKRWERVANRKKNKSKSKRPKMITVKQFKNKASELPQKDSTRTGIVFGDRFLKFMGIYGDFTRFIAEEVPEKTMDEGEEESKMMIDG